MEIEIHHLTVTIKKLRKSNIPTICDRLGIPQKHWTKASRSYDSIKYAFKGGNESAYWSLSADEAGRYNYSRLTLHGSFFDNSPDFDVFTFLADLRKLSEYTSKELDLCFFESATKPVIPLKKWEAWCNDPASYLSGNMLRKSQVHVLSTAGKFDKTHFGPSSSQSAFASLYSRDNMIRLELRLRSKLSDLIDYVLTSPESFRANAIDALTNQLDIHPQGTAGARNTDRHPLFTKYLGSNPRKLTMKQLKEAKQASREESDTFKGASSAARVAGYLNNHIAKHGVTDEFLELLTDATRKAFIDAVLAF